MHFLAPANAGDAKEMVRFIPAQRRPAARLGQRFDEESAQVVWYGKGLSVHMPEVPLRYASLSPTPS